MAPAPAARGVLIDGAGIGSSMAANKVPGIRAALCYDKASARNSREHNDSNVLTLGARLLTQTQAEDVLRTWLATPFAGGRHQARVQKILDIEQQYLKKGLLVTQAELDSLVAQIGEEILARVRPVRRSSRRKGRGPESARPGLPRLQAALSRRPARAIPRRSSPPAPTAFPPASG